MTTRIKGKLTVEGEGSVHVENVDVEGDIVVRAKRSSDVDVNAVTTRHEKAAQDRDFNAIVGWLISLGLILILAAVVVGILLEMSCR